MSCEVGIELNGSAAHDPVYPGATGTGSVAEAARWAQLPKAAIIDCLVHSIAQMPLCPQALVEARATASRLVLLLPTQNPTARQIEDAAATSIGDAGVGPSGILLCFGHRDGG